MRKITKKVCSFFIVIGVASGICVPNFAISEVTVKLSDIRKNQFISYFLEKFLKPERFDKKNPKVFYKVFLETYESLLNSTDQDLYYVIRISVDIAEKMVQITEEHQNGLFNKVYRNLLKDGYHPDAAEHFTYLFEEKINQGCSEKVAYKYAEMYIMNPLLLNESVLEEFAYAYARRFSLDDNETNSIVYAKAYVDAIMNGYDEKSADNYAKSVLLDNDYTE